MYHFVGFTLRDGRPVPLDGEWLEHFGPLKMCESGLHASPSPWEALQYAPGQILCEVEIEGDILSDTDKVVCRRRKIIHRTDLTETLRAFARKQALSVIHLWDAPDLVREYLETGKKELRAAARAAAWDAARDATRATARATARAAARAAAWDVAAPTAWDAARATARDAARAVAWDAARATARAAECDAAWDAARDAARAAGAALFNQMALETLAKSS